MDDFIGNFHCFSSCGLSLASLKVETCLKMSSINQLDLCFRFISLKLGIKKARSIKRL